MLNQLIKLRYYKAFKSMPELAEVETLRRYLATHILQEKIISYQQNIDKLRYYLAANIEENILASKIINVTRRAKFLHLSLDNARVITIHLGMSGRVLYQENHYQAQKHDHLIFNFASGHKLIYNDVRRFGMVYVCAQGELKQQYFLKNMGPEPLQPEFTAYYLHEKLKKKTIPIKTALMDNKLLVGVGNIYASESLFRANIAPTRAANNLSLDETEKLVTAIKQVLADAIENGGTSLQDFVNGDARPGYFQQKLNLYGREGKKCYLCDQLIIRIKQAGRSSFFCPQCQK